MVWIQKIHPTALGRILAKISFGSTLNIAASLANPVYPKYGVRGVYSRDLLIPVAKVMHKIGYKKGYSCTWFSRRWHKRHG